MKCSASFEVTQSLTVALRGTALLGACSVQISYLYFQFKFCLHFQFTSCLHFQFKSTPSKSVSVVGWMVMMADDPEHPDLFLLTDSEKGKQCTGSQNKHFLCWAHLSAAKWASERWHPSTWSCSPARHLCLWNAMGTITPGESSLSCKNSPNS